MNTMQQEFDAVVTHLFKQGRPARYSIHEGAYRGPNGTSCAVGCRIPDEMYDPEMEGDNVGSAVCAYNLPKEIEMYLGMFSKLQNAHDACRTEEDGTFSLASLRAHLKYVAEEFNLALNLPEGVAV